MWLKMRFTGTHLLQMSDKELQLKSIQSGPTIELMSMHIMTRTLYSDCTGHNGCLTRGLLAAFYLLIFRHFAYKGNILSDHSLMSPPAGSNTVNWPKRALK